MAYNKMTNKQLVELGRVIVTFNEDERLKLHEFMKTIEMPAGQFLGILIKKQLGFSVSKPLYESVMSQLKQFKNK